MTDRSLGSGLRRGQIVLVELDPVRGAEQGKTRPAVIVSNDAANLAATLNDYGVITVIPITSNTARVRPYQVLLSSEDTSLRRDGKAQAEQVRAVAVARIVRPLGLLPSRVVFELDEALRLHLAL